MRIPWGIALVIASVATADAQEVPVVPKSLKTLKVEGAATRPLFDVAPDGVLLIDWPLAEELIARQEDPKRVPLATLMLAIREGRWRPMPTDESKRE